MSFIKSSKKAATFPESDIQFLECDSQSHLYNNRIPQKAVILQMQDFYNLENKVANALIKAMPKCDATSIKIFELIVSAVNPKEPMSNYLISIETELLYKFLNLNSNSKGTDLKKKLINFRNDLYFDFSTLTTEERIQVNKAIEKENELISEERYKLLPIRENHIVSALDEIFWEVRSKHVSFKLTHKILFFLSNLGAEKLYTTYDLIGMNKFTSKYSVILYRYLRMEYQKFKYNQKQNSVKNKIEIDIEVLREMTDTVDLYARFVDFEERILKVPQEEINENSVIKFDYIKIKKGRSIKSIQFFIYDNPKNIPAKETRLTPRKSKEEREQERQNALLETIRSPYTKILRDRMFLDFDFIEDDALLIGLHDRLYSAYDELVEKKGIEFLKLHLSRVQNDRDQSKSINSLPDYLKTALEAAAKEGFWRELKFEKEFKKNKF